MVRVRLAALLLASISLAYRLGWSPPLQSTASGVLLQTSPIPTAEPGLAATYLPVVFGSPIATPEAVIIFLPVVLK